MRACVCPCVPLAAECVRACVCACLCGRGGCACGAELELVELLGGVVPPLLPLGGLGVGSPTKAGTVSAHAWASEYVVNRTAAVLSTVGSGPKTDVMLKGAYDNAFVCV